MIFLNQTSFLELKNIHERKNACIFCKGQNGRLFKFYSHHGKRLDYADKICLKKLGRVKIQGILEEFPLLQEDVKGFKVTTK